MIEFKLKLVMFFTWQWHIRGQHPMLVGIEMNVAAEFTTRIEGMRQNTRRSIEGKAIAVI